MRKIADNIEELSLYLFAFFCCFPQKISSTAFIVWGSVCLLHSLYNFFTHNSWILPFKKENIPAYAMMGFSCLGLLSIAFSDDSLNASRIVFGQRLCLLLVPIACLLKRTEISLPWLLRAFILGNLIIIFYSFAILFYSYWIDLEIDLYINFFQQCTYYLSHCIHRSYCGLNIIICYIALIYLIIKEKRSKWDTILGILFFIPTILFFLINNSRAETIALFAVIIALFIYYGRANIKKHLLIGGIVIAGFSTLLVFTPQNRLIESIEELTQTEQKESRQEPRQIIWGCATQLIQEKPWTGYGANNYQDELIEKYKEKGFTEAIVLRYNEHNQYLGALLSFGGVGLLTLLILLFSFPFVCPSDERGIFIPIALLLIISYLFESMLDRYAGCVTLSLLTIMVSHNKKEPDMHIHSTRLKRDLMFIIGLLDIILIGLLIYTLRDTQKEGERMIINRTYDEGNTFEFCAKSNNTFCLDNHVYSFRRIALSEQAEEYQFVIDCYVPQEYTGDILTIFGEGRKDYTKLVEYDMTRKGQWQTLRVPLKSFLCAIICRQEKIGEEWPQGCILLKNAHFE